MGPEWVHAGGTAFMGGIRTRLNPSFSIHFADLPPSRSVDFFGRIASVVFTRALHNIFQIYFVDRGVNPLSFGRHATWMAAAAKSRAKTQVWIGSRLGIRTSLQVLEILYIPIITSFLVIPSRCLNTLDCGQPGTMPVSCNRR